MDTPGWFIADLCLFFYCLVFFCLIPVSLGTFIFPAKKKIPQNDVSDLEVKFWDQLITPSTSKTEETQGCSRNRKVDTAGNKFVQLRRHIRLDTFSYEYIRIYIYIHIIYILIINGDGNTGGYISWKNILYPRKHHWEGTVLLEYQEAVMQITVFMTALFSLFLATWRVFPEHLQPFTWRVACGLSGLKDWFP